MKQFRDVFHGKALAEREREMKIRAIQLQDRRNYR